MTARAAGRAIVDEAKERRSEVIILGATRKRRFTERALGTTIDYVLQHAPCEVLINLVPFEGVYVTDGAERTEAAAAAAAAAALNRGPQAPDDDEGRPRG